MFFLTCKRYANISNPLRTTLNSLSAFAKFRSNCTHKQHQTVTNPPRIDERLHRLLQACAEAQALAFTRAFHALTITIGSLARQPIYFFNNVLSLYLSLGELWSARKMFDEMPQKNVVSYNAMVSGFCLNGEFEGAWEVFRDMLGCGFSPTQFTFGGLLSCDALGVFRGCMLHGLMLKSGVFYGEAYGGTALLGMFGRYGFMDEAIRVFMDMPVKSLITWNSIISLLGYHGFVEDSMYMFRELMKSDFSFSGVTLVNLLSGFAGQDDIQVGEQVHGLVIKSGLDYEISVSNALLNMYVKCSSVCVAERMFQQMLLRDIVTYNTMIGTLAKSAENAGRALGLLLDMFTEGISPNETTFLGSISCCTSLRILQYGEYIHAKLIRNAFESDVFVGSALVDFYGKCNLLTAARGCFDEIAYKNVVSWNSLIASYLYSHHSNSIALFQEMLQLGYHPNEFTLSSLFKTSSLLDLQEFHSFAIKLGYVGHEYVLSSILTSYAKNGLLSDALLLAESVDSPISVVSSNVVAAIYNKTNQFDKSLETLSTLRDPDIVSWNVLISACSHNGYHSEVFELFKNMVAFQIYPDNYTFASVLSSCADLHFLHLASSIHGFLVKTNYRHCDTLVLNILMDMYGKCGRVEELVKIFNEIIDKNFITWTTLISGLGRLGYAREALQRFEEMQLLGCKPDGVAIAAVISACRHGGLVKEGMELFSRMKSSFGIEPEMDHYLGVVDLLSRHGYLKETEQVIAAMPFPLSSPPSPPPPPGVWNSFLKAAWDE